MWSLCRYSQSASVRSRRSCDTTGTGDGCIGLGPEIADFQDESSASDPGARPRTGGPEQMRAAADDHVAGMAPGDQEPAQCRESEHHHAGDPPPVVSLVAPGGEPFEPDVADRFGQHPEVPGRPAAAVPTLVQAEVAGQEADVVAESVELTGHVVVTGATRLIGRNGELIDPEHPPRSPCHHRLTMDTVVG